ncbi:hypothetical protein JTE90_001985 [Oedothorax gibbosus]|uniref:Cyclin-D1-binding protein 1 n=1 Tax=Oedothorax gibbosus TaxID=931172 RepID=A0AAV6TZC0_9ARAC|nr:hypothetical protein JTE90_001985 [Oedothorax gibbosus]
MANSASHSISIRSILEGFERSLELAKQQITDERPDRENPDFDLNNFWTNFIGATKLVSHEATKLCMVFQGQGMNSTDECKSLIDSVEKKCLTLLAVFVTLPKSKGKTLHKEILLYVIGILQGMKSLCTAIRNQGNNQLQNVGDLWEQCGNVENLSKNNQDAVVAVCREQHDMVQDASQELMDSLDSEAQDMDDDLSQLPPLNGNPILPDQAWTPSDRNVLLPCSGLVKAAKACLKKTMQAIAHRGDASNEAAVNELDRIAEIVKESSSIVDDFVLSLYPPMDHSVARGQASLVRNHSKELLSTVRNCHFCSAVDETWVDFLEKAVDHNWVRINDMVLAD